ncbi:uncharacterized protein [Dysidea avara]
MYTDETSTVNVFTGNNFDVITPGIYYCEVNEQRGVYRSNSFTVYKIGFNKDFTVHPGNLTVYENTERYAFKCHINMFAEIDDHLSLMRIEWDGAMEDSEEFQLQDSQFSFSPLPGYSIFVRDVNGSSFDLFPNRYRCRAVFTLPNGSDSTVATSKVAFLLDTEGSGQGPSDIDDFLLSPTNTTVTVTDTAVFVCVPANSSFQPVWSPIHSSNVISGPNNYFLCLKDVEKSVRISCTVNGKTSNSYLSLQEIPALLIDSVLSNLTLVREGSNVTLECSPLMTTPTPTITWLANGSVVQVGTNQYTIGVVDETSRGVYQCLVEATFSPTTNSVGLPPSTSFIFTTLLDTFFLQTMIITPPEDQAVALGENVTFTCIASGTTPPSIVWAQIVDGNTIPISNDVEMLEMDNTVNSTLTISDVKQDYFGTYQCIAGEIDVASFTLYEAVVPSAPISVTANVTGSRNASVSWQEGVLPNTFSPPNLNFEVYLNGSLVNITNSTTVVLNSLSPFTDYKVTVVARNRIGISNISNPTLFMTKDEVPGAPPQSVTAYSPSAGNITIAWRPPPLELQYGIITGYEISFGIAGISITENSFSSDLRITRTGLLSNTTYSITVAAVNGAGTSDNTTTLNFNLPPSISDIAMPNTMVTVERIQPTKLIVDIANTSALFSHVWIVVARLSLANSSVLYINTNEKYPSRESFKTYFTAGDDEPYIVAEISAENYPTKLTLGDHLLTANISDFSDLDYNGPLTEGRDYSVFVRFFSYSSPVPRSRRNLFPDRQYSVFTSTEFSPLLTTAITISFGEPVYNIHENDELVVDLVLKSLHSVNVTVQINNDDVTATGDVDYNSGPYNVTVLAGNTVGFLNIKLIDDNLLEKVENFNLTIESSSLPIGIFLGKFIEASVVIVDNDETTINFGQSTYIIDEDNGVLQPVLILSNPSSTNIVIKVKSSDVNATGDFDYISGSYNIIIPPEVVNVTFNISIITDNILEGDELFYLKIDSSSLPDNVTAGSLNTTSVMIVDDDLITITFSQSAYTTDEDSGAVQVELVSSNPSMTDITVQVNTIDITTNGDDDYVTGPYNVTLFAGMIRRRFNISIANNNILEHTEVFNLTIDSSSLPSEVLSSDRRLQVVIKDDDNITINFNDSVYSTKEDNGLIQPRLIFSNPSSFDIAIQVDSVDINATAADYNPWSYDITMYANQTNVTFNISITTNNLLEGDKMFQLTIDSSSLPDAVTTGGQKSTTVLILDDDPISVNFSQSLYTNDENTKVVQPMLLLTNPSSTDITIQVRSINITAYGRGIDYDSGPFNLIIPAGKTSCQFRIEIINDNILENLEVFNLTVNPLSLPANVYVGNPNQTMVLIIDNDAIVVSFSQSLYTFAKNIGVARPEIIFSNPSSTKITVTVVSSSDNTTGGADFTSDDKIDFISGPYNITFPSGVTRLSFDIAIDINGTIEGRESFNLTISDILHPNITLGNIHQAVVLIVDNASLVMFNQSTYEVNENEPLLQALVLVNVPLLSNIVLNVEASSITATGNDYQSDIYNVTLEAGRNSTLINITIKDDTILEPRETFKLTILSVSPQGVISGTPNEAIVTIIDNDGPLTVQFSQSKFMGSESSTNMTIALVLGGGTSSSDITITVIPSEQSPLSAEGDGVDYTSTPLLATFSVGTTGIEISIPITEDDIIEPLEEIELIFTIPLSISNAIVAGTEMTATGVIIDSTVARMTFNQSAYMVGESDGEVHLEINLSNQTSQSIGLTVETLTDGTNATGGVDYRSGPYSLVLSAGTQSVSFNISVYDDNILEYNETFTITITIDDPTLSDRISTDTTTVIIIDNDPIIVEFSHSLYYVKEDHAKLECALLFTNPSAFEIIVYTNTTGITALGDTDYEQGPYMITFPTNITEAFYDISITDDNILEIDEILDITIDSHSLPYDVFVGNGSRAVVIIEDNDSITVNFSQVQFSCVEGMDNKDNGITQVQLMLSNPSSFDIIVVVASSNITAIGLNSSKHMKSNMYGVYNVTFLSNVTSQFVDIPICDDSVLEEDETFSLTIVSNSHPDNVTNGSPDNVIVTTDPITVHFMKSVYLMDINRKSVQLALDLSNPSSVDIIIQVKIMDINATEGMDYICTPSCIITFTTGDTTKVFNITLLNNEKLEGIDHFNVSIEPPNYVSQGTPCEALLLIVNMDDVALERPFFSLILLKGMTITLSCNPRHLPKAFSLCWTHNGTSINNNMDGITLAPVNRNHNLIIQSASLNNSGIYHCIASPAVSQSINVTVIATCDNDFSGGLLWPSSGRNRLVTQRCSELHPSFRSGVSVSRQCGDDGEWSPVDLRGCTMFINSNPLVIVYFTLNGSVTDDSTAEAVIEAVAKSHSFVELNVTNVSGSTKRYNTSRSEFVGLSISFTLQVESFPTAINETIKADTLHVLTAGNFLTSDDDVMVIAFQPNSSCSCDTTISLNAIQTICTGPSTPPCKCTTDCRCNSPTYVGDGKVCGVDSDYDGFPDVNLNCNIVPSCEGDLCPDIYSTISGSNGKQQDASFCSQAVNTNGCNMEQDTIWNITWPATSVGNTAIQKCPGGGEVEGLAARKCVGIGNWGKPDVSSCTTIEQIRLGSQIKNIERIVANILNNETRDLTERFDSQLVTNIARELNIVTNTSIPLIPNDVIQTANILKSIVNVAESGIDVVETLAIIDIVEKSTSVLSNLNDERNYASFQENGMVSEKLLMITERIAILLGNSLDRSSNVTVRKNITTENIFINAQLPTSFTAETITFPSDNSIFSGINTSALQIVIPREAILYRFSVEGKKVPVVNAIILNSRLPTNESQQMASVLLSSQISTTIQERVLLGGEIISLLSNLKKTVIQPFSDVNCAFWDFASSGFSKDGINITTNGSFVNCSSDHLTSFAVLVNVGDVPAAESTALSIVTYIGCGISIVCLIITIIMFLLFRRKVFNRIQHFIHFNLSLTLLVGLIVFVSGIENAKSSHVGCFIVAVLLHYFFIAAFCWMLCEALLLFALLYFVFYQGFFKSWKFYSILGWGMPVFIVLVSVGGSRYHYYVSDSRCWLNEDGAIWGFIGPMLLIIVVNFGQYAMTIRQVFKSKQSETGSAQTKLRKSVKKLLIAAMSLLPIFGVTWVFGLLAINDDTVVFAWIFTILNSLQGMLIFFFYVIKNEKMRNLLKSYIKGSSLSAIFSSTSKSSKLETIPRKRAMIFGTSEGTSTGNRNTLPRSQEESSRCSSDTDIHTRPDVYMEDSEKANEGLIQRPVVIV